MFPRRSQWGEVQTWVNSQWKIPTFPGQISTEINKPFLDALFGPGIAVYDPEADLWIAPDPKYSGPGFGFIAVRPDKSFFTGVVPTGAFN